MIIAIVVVDFEGKLRVGAGHFLGAGMSARRLLLLFFLGRGLSLCFLSFFLGTTFVFLSLNTFRTNVGPASKGPFIAELLATLTDFYLVHQSQYARMFDPPCEHHLLIAEIALFRLELTYFLMRLHLLLSKSLLTERARINAEAAVLLVEEQLRAAFNYRSASFISALQKNRLPQPDMLGLQFSRKFLYL